MQAPSDSIDASGSSTSKHAGVGRAAWQRIVAARRATVTPLNRLWTFLLVPVLNGGAASLHALCVSDNGIGIEAVHLEGVQRMFQRLHEHERFPGLGVGLSIAKKIVVRNGGSLEIASTHGKGTSVTLIFPA